MSKQHIVQLSEPRGVQASGAEPSDSTSSDSTSSDSTSRDATPRLQIMGLTVRFGGLVALDAVSFSVGAGETVALIGPNGAGKTTVFNAVCGLVRPAAGSIRLDGHPAPASTTDLLNHGVSRTLQGLGLFSGMSVLENVLVPLAAPSRSGRSARSTGAGSTATRAASAVAAATDRKSTRLNSSHWE